MIENELVADRSESSRMVSVQRQQSWSDGSAIRGTRNRAALLVMAIFLFGIFVDFGGAFGIKLALTGLALLWLLTRRRTLAIWYRHRWDFVVLLVLPIWLACLNLLGQNLMGQVNLDLIPAMSAVYSSVSSQFLILLFPLMWMTGVHRTQHLILIGMIAVVTLMVVLAISHVLGLIDLNSFAGFAREYRVGRIGIDTRQADLPARFRPLVGFNIAYTLVFGLGLALGVSWGWVAVICVGLVLLLARGMLLGAGAAVVMWLLFYRRLTRRFGRRVLSTFLILLLVLALLLLFEEMRGLLISNMRTLIDRFGQQVNAEDVSTLVRLGHLRGYANRAAENPLGVLFGFGPGADFVNSFTGGRITLTEMSSLNLVLWYGLPYFMLVLFWLFGNAWKLLRMRHYQHYSRLDTALVVGAVAFWLAGNTNPLMMSPIGIIALILIRVRIMELKQLRSR